MHLLESKKSVLKVYARFLYTYKIIHVNYFFFSKSSQLSDELQANLSLKYKWFIHETFFLFDKCLT